MLPLLIFIAADEIWGTQVGLYVAVATGITELIIIYIKQHKLEKFVLLDTLLIVALGIISLLTENAVFFKTKPAIIGVILCVIVGISVFSGKNLMLLMSRRYLKNFSIDKEAEKRLNFTLTILFWILVMHTLLVLYAAFYMSERAWAFISGPLLFIVFGAFIFFEFLRVRFHKPLAVTPFSEWVPLVDENGRLTGKATREAVHNGSKLLHPVVHLHIINGNRMILLQKRSISKSIQPGKWDTAVGGHVDLGETIEAALLREASEELLIENLKPVFMIRYIWESEIEKELVFSFVAFMNSIPDFEKSEIEEVRFWSQAEIKTELSNGLFTPNFEFEFSILQKELPKIISKTQK
ncbi:MAG: NUDIX domain-containing protein [Bacteroidales bacterium]|nr:NUDIX domain-containing protein [Bacteroidales bacterium]HOY38870.1 NUDIX domain-containing protein [Bacteroidales bacterium]